MYIKLGGEGRLKAIGSFRGRHQGYMTEENTATASMLQLSFHGFTQGIIYNINPFLYLGGRQYGPRNFRFEPKKIQIFGKISKFSRLKFLTNFFNPQLKKCTKFVLNSPFSGNIHL